MANEPLKSEIETGTNYTAPVDQLLAIGRPSLSNPDKWIDYPAEFGLTTADELELIRLATDEDLFWNGYEPEVYAPIHAMRALGKLQAEAAIAPLINIINWAEDSDWHIEEIPKTLGTIGPACLPVLAGCVSRFPDQPWLYAAIVSDSLSWIGQLHPEAREACVQHLMDGLSQYPRQLPDVNGSLVAALLDLNAVEAAELIGKAYTEGPMEEDICGTWPAVQVDLGIAKAEDFSPEELRLPPRSGPLGLGSPFPGGALATASGIRLDGKLRSSARSDAKFGQVDLSFKASKPKPKKSGFGNAAKPAKKKKKRK
ncbi:MAG: hypothetical protein AAF766_18805 [Cyanobacteria bacterium P01_D01_bin.14]